MITRRTLHLLILCLGAISFSLPQVVAAEKSKPAAEKSQKININTASDKELQELPGVGPVTAKKIIAGRPYASVKDLSKAGLSNADIEKIASQVTVRGSAAKASEKTAAKPAARETKPDAARKTIPAGAKTRESSAAKSGDSTKKTAERAAGSTKGSVNINTASEEELQELPGIGEAFARRIVENRPYRSAQDLTAKAKIPEATVNKFQDQITFGRASSTASGRSRVGSDAAAKRAPQAAPAPATAPRVEPSPMPTRQARPATGSDVQSSAEPRSAPVETRQQTSTEKPQASTSAGGKVDLNSASQQELEALPAVGPAYAKRIIEHRPYASVDELSKADVPARVIDQIRPQVSAGSSGRVWLNTDSNIYHREGDYWYGKTKNGKYVSEQEAIDAGARLSHEREKKE